LEQRRRAVLGKELLVLVGAERGDVLVHGDDVRVPGQEDAAAGQPLDGLVLAQSPVGGKRIVVEGFGQPLQIEAGRQRNGSGVVHAPARDGGAAAASPAAEASSCGADSSRQTASITARRVGPRKSPS